MTAVRIGAAAFVLVSGSAMAQDVREDSDVRERA